MATSIESRRARWWEVVRVFLKLGAMSYGGPAIMGIMQAEIQERRNWVSRERFVEGLALVNMLPGPGATQLGIFLGYVRAGWVGGLLAGLSFVLPAFFIMFALAYAYLQFGALPEARHVFYGVGPVVLAIFAIAVLRLGKAAVTDNKQGLIALAAGLALAFSPVGVMTILLLAGACGVGLYGSRKWGTLALGVMLALLAAIYYFRTGIALPVVAGASTAVNINGTAAPSSLGDIGGFFFTVGAFTFGGGLSVLAFMQDQVVNQLHWLTPNEFLDGLAMGQLTPGPILMIAAFVGYKLAGVAGAVVGGMAIFLPSFILMLSILPVYERIKRHTWIKAALKGIAPAVIGMTALALIQLLPFAVVDAATLLITVVSIGILLAVKKISPLALMLSGGGLGLLMRGGR